MNQAKIDEMFSDKSFQWKSSDDFRDMRRKYVQYVTDNV